MLKRLFHKLLPSEKNYAQPKHEKKIHAPENIAQSPLLKN